jgi:hypothetical protein
MKIRKSTGIIEKIVVEISEEQPIVSLRVLVQQTDETPTLRSGLVWGEARRYTQVAE